MNANIACCSGSMWLEIIGEHAPMVQVLSVADRKKSFEHVLTLQSEREQRRRYRQWNHRVVSSPPQKNGQPTPRQSPTKTRNSLHRSRRIFTASSLRFSRFFSSYVRLLQFIFTSIMAIFWKEFFVDRRVNTKRHFTLAQLHHRSYQRSRRFDRQERKDFHKLSKTLTTIIPALSSPTTKAFQMFKF